MMFDGIFKRKEKKKDEEKIVRKPIKYSEIATPFYRLEDHILGPGKISVSMHKLDWGEIGELWTVVEEIGRNTYRDIVTGMIISSQYMDSGVLNQIMDYPDKYEKIKDAYMRHPLAVEEMRIDCPHYSTRFVPRNYRELILEETLPKKEEIIEKMKTLTEVASEITEKHLNDMYKKSLENQKQILLKQIEEDNKKQEEIDYLKARIEEEKKRIKYEEDMNERFDSIFSK